MLLVEDRMLLDAFRRGDEGALVRVYRHYAGLVAEVLVSGFVFESRGRRCRFRGTTSTFDLEDRLQEVFARAFSERARLSYDGVSPYRGYILRIARNLVIDDFRSKERTLIEYAYEPLETAELEIKQGLVDPLTGLADVTGQPEVDAAAQQTLQLVLSFAESLPPRERTVLQLRFRDGLDLEQIAAQTNLSPSRIKTSEQRIRRQFFRYMKRHGYFDGYKQDRKGWLRFWATTTEEPS